MTNNSKNRREGFKVVVQDRWSLNSSGRYDDFDCSSLQLLALTRVTVACSCRLCTSGSTLGIAVRVVRYVGYV